MKSRKRTARQRRNSSGLNQMRVIVNEEIGASEVRSQEFTCDIETHLLKEMVRGFDRLGQRLDRFEHRVERVEYDNFGLSKINR